MKKPLIIIGGPTACGKTAMSILLAKKIGGEIISADSMQVYRYMDIGTAKVTKEEACLLYTSWCIFQAAKTSLVRWCL